MAIFCNCGSNNLEIVLSLDRRVHTARRFASMAVSMQNLARLAKQRPRGKKNEFKMAEHTYILQRNANRNSYVMYQKVTLPVTLNDV